MQRARDPLVKERYQTVTWICGSASPSGPTPKPVQRFGVPTSSGGAAPIAVVSELRYLCPKIMRLMAKPPLFAVKNVADYEENVNILKPALK